MEILCHPAGIVNTQKPDYGLNQIFQAGFDSTILDFSFCRNGIENPFIKNSFIKKCRELGISIPLAKIQGFYALSDDGDRSLWFPLIQECMKICWEWGIHRVIVPSPQEDWEINRHDYLHFLPWARKYDLQILLINQCKNLGGHYVRGQFSDAYEAQNCISELNHFAGEERFGFCMDVGACNICRQNMYEFSAILGNKIKTVIIRDNDGNTQGAMLPFASVSRRQCRTDWLNLFRGLRKIDFDGDVVMDFRDSVSALPVPLRSAILQYARQIGNHLRLQIELERTIKLYGKRVLFGAGNMCRNYMKCYGDAYTPLYICDNNSALWGTKYEGLTIKGPSELIKLPRDCAVFICNMYYEEIKKQLESMGIHNPICEFNDEYMPSLYLDRFDSEIREIR